MSGEAKPSEPAKQKMRVLGRRRVRNIPFVPQLTPTDCGTASLASVLAFHGKNMPIANIRQALGGGRNGVSARQLVQVARTFGLRARGVGVEPQSLAYLPTASILHWDLNHFVVFEKVDKKFVYIVDPGVGRRKVALADASKSLTGVAIVMEPGEDFVREKGTLALALDSLQGLDSGRARPVVAHPDHLVLPADVGPGTAGLDGCARRQGRAALGYAVAHAGELRVHERHLVLLPVHVPARASLAAPAHQGRSAHVVRLRRAPVRPALRVLPAAHHRRSDDAHEQSERHPRDPDHRRAVRLLDGIMVLVYFVLLMGASCQLGLVALAVALLQVVVYLYMGKRNSELMAEGLAAQSQLEGYQVEMLVGRRDAEVHGRGDQGHRALDRPLRERAQFVARAR